MSADDARASWDDILKKVARHEHRVLVQRGGIAVAAIVSADDLARLQRFEAERKRDFSVLYEIGDKFKNVPPQELEREVTKAVAEVRAENRQLQKRTSNTP
jgi:prevent-host-death family protein